jgi:hypothetical protein
MGLLAMSPGFTRKNLLRRYGDTASEAAMSFPHAPVAIAPCSDLDASGAFYNRLGFARAPGAPEDYRILADKRGGEIHLAQALEGWLVPGRNPFGLYLRTTDVDTLAACFAGETVGGRQPEDKP